MRMKGNALDLVLMSAKLGMQQLSRGAVPQFDFLVPATRRNGSSIGAKGQRGDRLMVHLSLQEFFACVCLPDHDCAIGASKDKALAIGSERQSVHGARAFPRVDQAACLRIPDS